MHPLPFSEGESSKVCSSHNHSDRVRIPSSFEIITDQDSQKSRTAHEIQFASGSQIREIYGFNKLENLRRIEIPFTVEIVKRFFLLFTFRSDLST
jgi:hypothetical protein